jgi:hypothetical protein
MILLEIARGCVRGAGLLEKKVAFYAPDPKVAFYSPFYSG